MRRRARGAGVIAVLIAAATVLAGCSSSADESMGYDGGADSGGAPAVAEDYAGEEAMADDAAEAPSADRSVIVTGSIYMTVDEPVAAADQVVMIVESSGGRVDGRSEVAPDEDFGGQATLTLRIPADQLDAIIERFRTLGTIDELSTDSVDVSTEVTDLDARISTLRASTERIEGLLAEAEDISDIIDLEDELSSRQAQLQSLEAQQRGLNDQVSLSTIYLSLTTEPVVVVVDDDTPSNFWEGLVDGWEALVGAVSVGLVVVGVLLPWVAVGAIIVLIVVGIVRSRRSRRPSAPPAPAQPAPVPATASAPDSEATAPSQADAPSAPTPPSS